MQSAPIAPKIGATRRLDRERYYLIYTHVRGDQNHTLLTAKAANDIQAKSYNPIEKLNYHYDAHRPQDRRFMD
jgi:hypothetical protein